VTQTPRLLALVAAVSLAGCGSRAHLAGPPPPASPQATVDQFLAAVNADDLRRMSQLFGDERGPVAVTQRDASKRELQMQILQRLLVSDSVHKFGTEQVPGYTTRRLLRLELFRGNRSRAVPVTVAEQRAGGWLVMKLDVDALLPGGNSGPTP